MLVCDVPKTSKLFWERLYDIVNLMTRLNCLLSGWNRLFFGYLSIYKDHKHDFCSQDFKDVVVKASVS